MTWRPGGGIGVFDARVFDSVVFHTVFGVENGTSVAASWNSVSVLSSGWTAGTSV